MADQGLSTERVTVFFNMELTQGGGVEEHRELRVPRGYRGRLTQMFGAFTLVTVPSAQRTVKFAIIARRGANITLTSWADIMLNEPVWIDLVAQIETGTPADVSQPASIAHVDIDFRNRGGLVEINNTGRRSNSLAGWVFVSETQSSAGIDGGLVINMELDWLGGHGGGNSRCFDKDGFFMDQCANNNGGT